MISLLGWISNTGNRPKNSEDPTMSSPDAPDPLPPPPPAAAPDMSEEQEEAARRRRALEAQRMGRRDFVRPKTRSRPDTGIRLPGREE